MFVLIFNPLSFSSARTYSNTLIEEFEVLLDMREAGYTTNV